MKKKIITIVASSLGAIVVSALLAMGILMLVQKRNVAETGNVLGVVWYNEEDKEFEITTAEQLNDLARLSKFYDFKGQTVKLSADIVMNEGNAEDWATNAPKTRWMPIQQFNGTFDGQGHNISGLYGKGYESPMALFAKTGSSAVVQNISLVNSYFQTGGSLGAASFAVEGEGRFIKLYSDAIIVNRGEYSAGIITKVSMSASLEECWFDGSISQQGRYMGGIVAVANSGRVNISHCLFSGSLTSTQKQITYAGTDGVRTGGICGTVNENATLIMTDSLISGSFGLEHTTYSGSVIGAIFNGGSANATDVYTTEQITGRDTIGSGSGRAESLPVYMEKTDMIGVKAYQWTTLDFDNYWVVVEEGTPILKTFADEVPSLDGIEKEFDISWYNANIYEATLTNLKELYGLALLSKSTTFKDVVIRLGADIVVNEGKAKDWEKNPDKAPANPWNPIGTSSVPFSGTFDGQGHSISGIYYDANGEAVERVGVFGTVGVGGIIQNLKVTNSFYNLDGNKDQRYAGGVVAVCKGTLDTLYSDVIIEADGRDIGGIVGYLNYSGDLGFSTPFINNCWFNGKITGSICRRVGGIAAVVFGVADAMPTYTFTNCLNTGYISNKRVPNSGDGLGGQYIGGIIGQEVNPCNVILRNCLMSGTIDTEYATYVGSVMGRLLNDTSTLTLDNMYTTSESFKRVIHEPKGTQIGSVIVLPEKMLTGVSGYKWTALDFSKYWVATSNKTPVLKSFSKDAKMQTISVAKVKRMVDISWYKASAKEMTIDTLEELYGLWLLSNGEDFEGQTIKLGANIEVNKVDAATLSTWKSGIDTAVNPWFPIGSNEMRFTGTFDGQMHTISGIYLNTELRNRYIGVFGCTGTGSTIKNLKVTNSVYDVNGDTSVCYVGGIVGYNRGNLDTLYSDVDIITDGQDIGGIAGYLNFYEATAEQRIHNLWFNGSISGDSGRRMGGITGVVYGKDDKVPTYRFDNCLNTATISNTRKDSKDGFGGQLIGGILGKEANQTNVILKDCMNAGTIDLTYKTYAGNLIGRPETKASVYQIDNVYMLIDAFSEEYNGANATVNGHIFKFTEQTLKGAGGYKWTSLDFNKYWVAVENDTPVLKSFAECAGDNIVDVSTVAKVIDTKWYDDNPDAQTFKIGTKDDLYGLWSLVARGNSFKGKEIELVADVAVNDVDVFADGTTSVDKWKDGTAIAANPWFPIGSSGAPFAGTFDGNNHTISGICVNDSAAGGSQGIFAYLGKEGVIKNLKATDSLYQVKGDNALQYIGGIVAYAQGSLINLYSAVDIVTDGHDLGGIAGYLDYTGETDGRKVKNCWFNGSISGEKARRSGGIIGSVLGHSTKDAVYNISNCLFTGYVGNERVPKSGDGCGGQYIGGILGRDTNTAEIHISDSLVAGTVYSKYTTFMASVVGHIGSKDTTLTVDSIYVTKESYSGDFVHSESLGDIQGVFTQVSRGSLYGYGAPMTIEFDFESAWSAVVGSMPIPTALLESKHQVVTLNTDWYDDAEADGEGNEPGHKKNPYKIGNAGDLYGLAKLINQAGVDFTGKTIVLTGDITINSSDVASTTGLSEWTPIIAFTGIFDGQRHKISGLKITDANNGMFKSISGKVGNFTLSQSDIRAKNSSGAIVGTLSGELYDIHADKSVTVKHWQKQYVAGLVGQVDSGKKAIIRNCSFAGKVQVSSVGGEPTTGGHAGIVSYINNAECEIVNCVMSGSVEKGWQVGGLIGRVYNGGSKVTIRNCLVTGEVSTIRTGSFRNVDTLIGTIEKNANVYIEDVYSAGINRGQVDADNNILAEGTKYGTMPGIAYCDKDGNRPYIYGLTEEVAQADIKGAAAWNKLNLDFYSEHNEDGVWVAIEDGLPKLRIAVTEEDTVIEDGYTGTTPQYGWYNLHTKKTEGRGETQDVTPAEGTTFELETAGDLLGWNRVVRGDGLIKTPDTFSGDTVMLTDSVNLNPNWDASQKTTPSVAWLSIGSSGSFAGTFDGDNHTISGLYVSSTGFGRGMFATLTDTTIIKDFTLSNSYISGKNNVGAIAGTMQKNSELQNVRVDNTVFVKGNLSVGGLVGAASGANTVGQVKMTGCSFAGTIDATDIYPSSEDNTQGRCGGLIGEVRNGHNVTIDRCSFTGSAQGVNPLGGIVGYVRESSSVTITNSIASGTLQLTYVNGNTDLSSQVGQIVGLLTGSATVTLTKVDSDNCVCYKADGTKQADRVRTDGTFILNDNDK